MNCQLFFRFFWCKLWCCLSRTINRLGRWLWYWGLCILVKFPYVYLLNMSLNFAIIWWCYLCRTTWLDKYVRRRIIFSRIINTRLSGSLFIHSDCSCSGLLWNIRHRSYTLFHAMLLCLIHGINRPWACLNDIMASWRYCLLLISLACLFLCLAPFWQFKCLFKWWLHSCYVKLINVQVGCDVTFHLRFNAERLWWF